MIIYRRMVAARTQHARKRIRPEQTFRASRTLRGYVSWMERNVLDAETESICQPRDPAGRTSFDKTEFPIAVYVTDEIRRPARQRLNIQRNRNTTYVRTYIYTVRYEDTSRANARLAESKNITTIRYGIDFRRVHIYIHMNVCVCVYSKFMSK